MLVRLLLFIAYFIFLFPFGILAYFFADFLEVKKKSPYWILCNKIEDVNNSLKQQ